MLPTFVKPKGTELRMCEHLGISYMMGMPTKFNMAATTGIRDNIRSSGHLNNFNNFKILNFGKYNLECSIKESLLIEKFSPPLNKQVNNLQLSIF